MAGRYDVSTVSLQGGYVAKQCPVRAQWDVLEPCEPLPTSAVLERRFALGRQFEADVISEMLRLHPDATVVDDQDRDNREGLTLDAMRSGAALILGGRLPADHVGRRVGEPDVLVRTEGSDTYRAVDIKHHRSLEEGTKGLPARCSQLGAAAWEDAEERPACSARKNKGDLLQLAHYQRMLEAAGVAAPDGRHAGIIGKEQVVTWYDLGAPIWSTPSSTGRQKKRSSMERYDFEFDFRLDIIAVAERHRADPDADLIVAPVRISECAECPWWSHCGPVLEEGSGDVSLVPRMGFKAWRIHRDHGVCDRRALADLDYRTASLVAAKVDLRPVLGALGRQADSTPVASIVGARKQDQVKQLAEAGVSTLGDARGLCPRTASYCDDPIAVLAEQIDLARAALGDAPVYRRRAVERVVIARADVEVDVDMENVEDGVYLWGAQLLDPSGLSGLETGYRGFCTWDPLTPDSERLLFEQFWSWLADVRSRAASRGLSFRAYCYSEAAENTQMHRIAKATALEEEVEAFIGSEQWLDLLKVFGENLLTGSSIGLKVVASLSGFSWEVDDPGGAESMLHYDRAMDASDPLVAAQERQWLLAYNRNDVEATWALREWLDSKASEFPSVACLGG